MQPCPLHQTLATFPTFPRLKNKANKTKDPTDTKSYKKQRNYVAYLDKEAKLEYFSKFGSNDNKPFWVNCKPDFSGYS